MIQKKIKVLFTGEAIIIQTIVYKDWDSLHLANYSEHGNYFLNAMKDNYIAVNYLPTYRVSEEFPSSIDELKKYDVIAISDIGS
jgi:uncharacterized membrane protein